MAILVGTSGYNYPEWKGSFYPEKLPSAKMLPYYAERFPTVEINYTFYRMPTARLLAGWAAQTPPGFRFSLKAPRRMTHDAKLRDCAGLLRDFCEIAAGLGDRLGALLFQLPPSLRLDLAVFDRFLDAMPPGARAAFEFRHASWLTEEAYQRLRARNLALCVADSGRMSTPIVATASYGYFRLRDEGYGPADIDRWAGAIREQLAGWTETFVYFKHEEQGKGPELARALIARFGSSDADARMSDGRRHAE
jgi:uncharacterized protein YecE (DUF72 family)